MDGIKKNFCFDFMRLPLLHGRLPEVYLHPRFVCNDENKASLP